MHVQPSQGLRNGTQAELWAFGLCKQKLCFSVWSLRRHRGWRCILIPGMGEVKATDVLWGAGERTSWGIVMGDIQKEGFMKKKNRLRRY